MLLTSAASSGTELEGTMLMLVMTICGILVVFLGLVLLIIIIGAFGKITSALENRKRKSDSKPNTIPSDPIWSAPALAKSSAAPAAGSSDIPDEIIAVIAAAVASMEGGSYAIRSVRRSSEGRPAWSMAGIYENIRPF